MLVGAVWHVYCRGICDSQSQPVDVHLLQGIVHIEQHTCIPTSQAVVVLADQL